jgi:hypothetical protein
VPSLNPAAHRCLGTPAQTGSLSGVPWTIMPPPLVGMAVAALVQHDRIVFDVAVDDFPEVHDPSAHAGKASANSRSR